MTEADKGKDIRHLVEPLTVQHGGRQVIEGRLLAALEEEGKVAVVLSEADLDVLIGVLQSDAKSLLNDCRRARLFDGLRTLRLEAFGRF